MTLYTQFPIPAVGEDGLVVRAVYVVAALAGHRRSVPWVDYLPPHGMAVSGMYLLVAGDTGFHKGFCK